MKADTTKYKFPVLSVDSCSRSVINNNKKMYRCRLYCKNKCMDFTKIHECNNYAGQSLKGGWRYIFLVESFGELNQRLHFVLIKSWVSKSARPQGPVVHTTTHWLCDYGNCSTYLSDLLWALNEIMHFWFCMEPDTW